MHTPLPHLEVLPIEGQRSADQRVEDDAQAPDVHLGPVVFLALEELGGGVRRGTAERVQLVPQSELVAEAKVGYFDVHVGVQQQVLGLQTGGIGGEMGSENAKEGKQNRRTYSGATHGAKHTKAKVSRRSSCGFPKPEVSR